MSDQTNIRVTPGQDVEIDNQGGGPVRVLVVRSDTGDAGYRQVPRGSRVGDVVDGDHGREVRRNGHTAHLDDELEDNDKVTVTPSNPEGN